MHFGNKILLQMSHDVVIITRVTQQMCFSFSPPPVFYEGIVENAGGGSSFYLLLRGKKR